MMHPASIGELLDYWLGDLSAQREAAIEEHVFECADCGARLDEIRGLGSEIVALLRRGEVAARGTAGLVNRLARDQLNVRQYTLHPGEVVACTVTTADDLLLARLALGTDRPARVDVSVRDGSGQEFLRIDDVVVDARSNQVITFVPARPHQADPSGRVQYVLLASEPGGERVLGTYTLEHTAMNEAG